LPPPTFFNKGNEMKIVNLTMTAMDKLRAARDNKLGTSVSAFGAGPRKRDKKGAALRLRNYQSDLETHEAIEKSMKKSRLWK
jgi:hypothetical protein